MDTGEVSPAGKEALPVACDRAMFAGLDLRRRLGRGILVRLGIRFVGKLGRLTACTFASVKVVGDGPVTSDQ